MFPRSSQIVRGHLLDDPWLAPYREAIVARHLRFKSLMPFVRDELAGRGCGFTDLRLADGEWVFREYAPNATAVRLVGDFSDWRESEVFALRRVADGAWEGRWPEELISHGQRYHLVVEWPGGRGERMPAYARRVVQDWNTGLYEAQVWNGAYKWHDAKWVNCHKSPMIYEAHVGMAQEEPKVGTYAEFRERTLPRIAAAGYDTIQLMGVMEHPYYGSFGYHVGSFFAPSSRFGTPEELKELVDAAHGMGIAVVMDIVHSHAVRNERDGLSLFDGTPHLYFHKGERGWHSAWDSRCFDYANPATLRFLLANCRYWLEEFHFDGFRFDGVTSMLYRNHGLSTAFTDYSMYFGDNVDEDAWAYLALANELVHRVRPDAVTIAEDVSGMPGVASPHEDCGMGFDLRMAMGVTDMWFKYVKDVRDEDWDIGHLWSELVNRRAEERTVSYVECHDQSLVGGKTMLFEMLDDDMYTGMSRTATSPRIDRGIALHKMARLSTAATASGGYLNFIGNEYGHPEWIDFPREGNGYSFMHARRQWSLRDNDALYYSALADFDKAMLELLRDFGIMDADPRLLAIDGKFLAFERNELFFAFNFDPGRALVDHPLVVPPGRYRGILNTDAAEFGGQGRIPNGIEYSIFRELRGCEQVDTIRLYLPPRTALVIERRFR